MITNTVGDFLNAVTASSVGVAACVRCNVIGLICNFERKHLQ